MGADHHPGPCSHFLAIFADVIVPHDPQWALAPAERFRPPAWQQAGSTAHLLGTDHVGRDVLSAPDLGARVSMVVGFTAVIFAGVVGTVLGILAGRPRAAGWIGHHARDRRVAGAACVDVRDLPGGLVGPSERTSSFILGIVYWTR